jgi:hypothetical protein
MFLGGLLLTNGGSQCGHHVAHVVVTGSGVPKADSAMLLRVPTDRQRESRRSRGYNARSRPSVATAAFAFDVSTSPLFCPPLLD